MTLYLQVEAASFRLLIDVALVEHVAETDAEPALDLSRALGGSPGAITLVLGPEARVGRVKVDIVRGLISLGPHEFAPLPARLQPTAGEDVEAVTRRKHDGGHGFRLRLARSSAAGAG